MRKDKIKDIAQERIEQRQEYNTRRLQQLFSQDAQVEDSKVVIPHETFVRARHNGMTHLIEDMLNILNSDTEGKG